MQATSRCTVTKRWHGESRDAMIKHGNITKEHPDRRRE